MDKIFMIIWTAIFAFGAVLNGILIAFAEEEHDELLAIKAGFGCAGCTLVATFMALFWI